MLLRKDRSSGDFFGRRGHRSAAPSLLSVDVKIEGDVIAEGDLYVGGAVKGRVVARQLTLGEGATITGIVEVESALISGTLTGKLTARAVTLKRTATVSADITHSSFIIEPGATFEGFSRHVVQPAVSTIEEDSPADAVAALSHAG